MRAKAVAVSDGKAASARLDGAKILLGEKRGVIEEVYARALKKLVGLGEKETLYLSARLLGDYAEEGDEIVFAENFPFAQNVAALPVVKEKKLKVSARRAKLDGGFMLCGKSRRQGRILRRDTRRRQRGAFVRDSGGYI